MALQWLHDCSHHHVICREAETKRPAYLPTRLIDIHTPVRLVYGHELDQNARYITLSHCWGKYPLNCLTNASLTEFRQSIPLAKLSQSFQDAVHYTRKLGLRYLWIDSLCIIQDSINDWQHESLDMQLVYSNSWCTIAATAFSDGQQGFFATRDPNEVFDLPNLVARKWPFDRPEIYHCIAPSYWKSNIEDSPLSRRAWVLQERLLSPRVLHFAKNQIFWECFSKQASETFPDGLPMALLDGALDKVSNHQGLGGLNDLKSHENWDRVVETYSNGLLTKETDKLVAISGLARANYAFHELVRQPRDNGPRYLAGMWNSKDLFRQLCWSVRSDDTTHLSLRTQSYVAPSWSWACLTGKVGFPDLDFMEWYRCAVCREAYASPRMANELGPVRSGYLLMEGLLRLAVLLHNPALLLWQPRSYKVQLNGKVFDIQLRPDTCQPNSEMADISLPPLDNNFRSLQEMSSTQQHKMNIYLFPIRVSSSDRGGHRCVLTGLWLRPTGKANYEFARIGLFVVEADIQGKTWAQWWKSKVIRGERDTDDPDDVQRTAYTFLSAAFPIFIRQKAPEIQKIDDSKDGSRVKISIV